MKRRALQGILSFERAPASSQNSQALFALRVQNRQQ